MLKRSSIKCLAIMLVLVALIAPPAWACGTAMLLPILFKAYPEAQEVYYATRAARAEKLISGPNWPGIDVVPLHEWRVHMTKLTLMALKHKLKRTGMSKPVPQTAFVMFVSEFVWVKIELGGGKVNLAQGQFPPLDAARIFSSRRTFDALLTGKISWDEAAKRKLVVIRPRPDGSAGETRFMVDAFRKTLPETGTLTKRDLTETPHTR
ncbi:MAG: hypothetical protein ACR2OR_01380 [Hyphomicrobiales bacterium]